MREIKFRAWYEPDKQTKDGALKFQQAIFQDQLFFTHGLEDDEYCGRLIKYPFEVPFLDDDWTVEQFTGLTDKNGVEIYEGDIVKTTGNGMYKLLADPVPEYTNGEIKFFNSAWKVCQKGIGSCDLGNYTCCDGEHEEGSLELIGNIHQNPELLK